MQDKFSTCCYILKIKAQDSELPLIQVRNARFDLLGQFDENDLGQLQDLAEWNFSAEATTDLQVKVKDIPYGKLERIAL